MSTLSGLQAPCHLRCEYLTNPLGIETAQPRLSWEVRDDRRGAVQTAYQIVVASTAARASAGKGDLWDSRKVGGSATCHIAYAGKPLTTLQDAFWRVRTWDGKGEPSAWSETASWGMGVLEATAWQGEWISVAPRDNSKSQPAPYLRRGFKLAKVPGRARIAISALGVYELTVNGKRVGEDQLTPGWTEYRKRVPYQVYDVSGHLRKGENVIGAILGDGWYCGYLAFRGNRNLYGQQPALKAMLCLDDEAAPAIVTDAQWQVTTGPILASDLYNGETYDAGLEMPGWDAPGFAADGWAPASVVADSGVPLTAKLCENVQAIDCRQPLAYTEPTPGVHLYDLGQNMVGRVRLRIKGRRGTTITIRHGEMLQNDGTLYTANLRSAEAIDRYTLKGGGVEIYEPRFTFHGFRYVEVTGCAKAPALEDVTGVVLHSATPPTGAFACSNELVNKLQSNIVWGQKGNFLEVPTDCPQRDERLGWTGDAQVFVRTACFNMDVAAFFTKWTQDLRDAQRPDGSVPDVIPDVTGGGGNPAWADATVICPWTIYLCYGDQRILADHYASMDRWIEHMRATSTGLIRPAKGYGDWLAIDNPPRGCDRGPTPKDLIGTAYFVHDCDLMAKIARILGKDADAARYQALADDVRAAFNREFVTPGGRIVGHSQTGYLLALGFDLLPEATRAVALNHLVSDLEKRGWHLSTGFVGTPLLAPVLTRCGRPDVAYKLLLQDTYPSWLYTIHNGATTMWERWDSYTKEHGFGEVSMNSFNHYAYGSIGAWMYSTVAGIDVDETQPGYGRIVIRPLPGGGLTWVKAELRSIRGSIVSRWQLDGTGATFDITLPANTTARVELPVANPAEVTANGQPLAQAEGITAVRVEANKTVFQATAGAYRFAAATVQVV